MDLLRRIFYFLSWISTNCSSYDKSGWISTGSYSITCLVSGWYFLSIDTWNTLWICCIYGGSANSYATFPTGFRISKGPTNLGLSLPLFPNLVSPFHGDTFNSTWSPTWKFTSFLAGSAYFHSLSWATLSLPRIISTDSFVYWTNSDPSILRSPTSSQQVGDLHFLPYRASYD